MDFSLLTRLTRTPGVSGREELVRKLVADELAAMTSDITIDPMGSLITHLPGKGPRVVLMAHMDEIGFLVSKIEDGGFVRVMPVGGIDPRVFGAQKVIVHGRQDLPGIVGSIPPHLLKQADGADRKEALPIEESFIDLGLDPDQVDAVVRIGDPVTFGTEGWETDRAVFAKALDDRVGLFVMIQAARQAKQIDADLYLIASTQEEYGLRGAGPAAFGVAPHIALVLEGTVASDTPGLKLPANLLPTAQGKGPEIRLSDARMLSDRPLADFLARMATAANIPHQVIVKKTGSTDAAAIQTAAAGIKTLALSVPVRYIHAPTGMVRKEDIRHTIDLAAAFLEKASSAVKK
jgi:tetrahedral aminopeptidase